MTPNASKTYRCTTGDGKSDIFRILMIDSNTVYAHSANWSYMGSSEHFRMYFETIP